MDMHVRTVIILKGALLAEFHLTGKVSNDAYKGPEPCINPLFQYEYEGVAPRDYSTYSWSRCDFRPRDYKLRYAAQVTPPPAFYKGVSFTKSDYCPRLAATIA